jgi:ATP-dependent DNA ligase
MPSKVKARFIEPMLLLRAEALQEGADWLYEIKFDGYRALAIKTGGKVQLRSRNDSDFSARYPGIVKGLAAMPDETVIDGEVVALDEEGKPSFNILQNYGSSIAPVHFYVFDVIILAGRDVMGGPLTKRRELLEKRVLPRLTEPIRHSPQLRASLEDLIQSVKAQGLEGLVAKRGEQVPAGTAVRRLAKDESQSGTGVRDCWIHALGKELRCTDHWLLRRRQANLRSAHSQWIHAGVTS